jgi:hypothetical protein
MIFGRKSEKVTREIEQLELKLEELETGKAERVLATTKTDAPPRNKPTRRPLPAHLPREVHTYLPTEEACPDCGGELRKLGEDVSEILERIPASCKVIQHVRPKMACAKCDVIVRHGHHRGRLNADLPDQRCWRMCSFPSTRTIVCPEDVGLFWRRRTIQKMRVGPSKAAIRSRFQTAVCCCR